MKPRIRLFGSRADGTCRPGSDIDVLLEGSDDDVQKIKDKLSYYSIEQGGPLDLFVLGSVDNEIDLVAAYATSDQPRTIAVGNQEDLDEILSNSYDISLQTLTNNFKAIDVVWNESSSVDRIQEKTASKMKVGF